MAKAKTPPPPTFEERFTAELREGFLQQVRQGMRRGAACDFVFGEDNPSLRKELREFIADNPGFEELVEDAETDATEHVEEALYQAAISGSVSAAKIWLEYKGAEFTEQRGRPRKEPPAPGGSPSDDSFSEFANVTALPRREGACVATLPQTKEA